MKDRGEDLSVMAVHVGLPVRAVGFCFAIDGPFDLVASRRDLHEGVDDCGCSMMQLPAVQVHEGVQVH